MLSLEGVKSFVLHGKPRTEFASGRGLQCKNKAKWPQSDKGPLFLNSSKKETNGWKDNFEIENDIAKKPGRE